MRNARFLIRLATHPFNQVRRRFLGRLFAAGGLAAAYATPLKAQDNSLRFPGENPPNKVVYQFNKGDAEYHNSVLFSVGAMLRKYTDDVAIAVVCIGPGLQILTKNPTRPVAKEIQERVSSLNQYGVKFIACGNTMKSLKLTAEDLVPFAEITEVGAAALMELQQKGYAYISW
ncbi:MAG: DsrE family protein [Gammaproteobacteria bacterium]|nr:DsrE family protein [Gammaproteobacteria bacterium]